MFLFFIVRVTPESIPSVFGVTLKHIKVFMHREMVRGLVVLAPLASGVKRGYPNRHKISHKTPEKIQSLKCHKVSAQVPKFAIV